MESFLYWNHLESNESDRRFQIQHMQVMLVSVVTAVLAGACCVAAVEHSKRRSKV